MVSDGEGEIYTRSTVGQGFMSSVQQWTGKIGVNYRKNNVVSHDADVFLRVQ